MNPGEVDARFYLFVRHAETDLNVEGVVSGDPRAPQSLTPAGHRQALRLGRAVRAASVDVVATSTLPRAIETADVALAGIDVERITIPEFNDPLLGDFEMAPFADYESWVAGTGLFDRAPGGGESQLDVVERYATGFEKLESRSESNIWVMAHALVTTVALAVAAGDPPLLRSRYIGVVDHCEPHAVSRRRLAHGRIALRQEMAAAKQASDR